MKGNPNFLQFLLKFINLDLFFAKQVKENPNSFIVCVKKTNLDPYLAQEVKGNSNFLQFLLKKLIWIHVWPKNEGEY